MTRATVGATRLTPAEALAHLSCLDLSMVRMKLADADDGKGWSTDELDQAEQEYRRFLALHLMYPERSVVPCHLVDEVWHAHILDTQAYAPDCDRLFGFFLHHFPYFGMRGEQDASDLIDAYDETLMRYREAWGEPPAGTWAPDSSARCKRRQWRTQCKPQKCT
jgi:hypothetical protein